MTRGECGVSEVRKIELVPPPGWKTLWSVLLRGDVVIALMFGLHSWTIGVDFWRAGGGVCVGPLVLAVGYYPDDEAGPA